MESLARWDRSYAGIERAGRGLHRGLRPFLGFLSYPPVEGGPIFPLSTSVRGSTRRVAGVPRASDALVGCSGFSSSDSKCCFNPSRLRCTSSGSLIICSRSVWVLLRSTYSSRSTSSRLAPFFKRWPTYWRTLSTCSGCRGVVLPPDGLRASANREPRVDLQGGHGMLDHSESC